MNFNIYFTGRRVLWSDDYITSDPDQDLMNDKKINNVNSNTPPCTSPSVKQLKITYSSSIVENGNMIFVLLFSY